MRTLALLCLCFLLPAAASGQTGRVVIVNDSSGNGWNVGNGSTIKVLDSGRPVAKLKNHEVVTLEMPIGLHGFALSFKKKQVTVLRIEPGQTYTILVWLHQGFARSDQGLRVLTGDEAAYYQAHK